MKKTLLLLALCSACGVSAAPLELTFSRTGTTADAVTVTASGIDGVTATLTSVSHSLKGLSNAAILCPDVNGNTSPTITFDVEISGIPATEQFNTLGLNIHALNSDGGYQYTNDNKKRQWNVTSTLGGQAFAEFSNIDIADGVAGAHKVWEASVSQAVNALNPTHLQITVTKGDENLGCFFGLAGITLSYQDTPVVEPPVVDLSGSKIYTIKWKNNTSSYVAEQSSGNLAITSYSTTSPIFWEFIPTDNEDCYYIRNTASGKYIGSCNMNPSAASKVMMSDTPVEYYVGTSAATSGENRGCKWLSSTDCDNYSNETSGARTLNKDGASNYVITWTTGLSNTGSYWTLVETEDLYSPVLPGVNYNIVAAANGLNYSSAGTWDAQGLTDAHRWQFAGPDAGGCYQIVNPATQTPLDAGSYKPVKNGMSYNLVDAQGNLLELAGQNEFRFVVARSKFALGNQIYSMPCGAIGNCHITRVEINDDFTYPMPQKSGNTITIPNGSAQKYVILSKHAANVVPANSSNITVTLNRAAGDHTLMLFADWNRDGVFEYSQSLNPGEAQTLSIPTDAALGKTRIRLRLNSNGLNGADDEVAGQVVDLLLNVVDPTRSELIDPIVTVNDTLRGTAVWNQTKAVATPKGTAMLLYWLNGPRIISLNPEIDCVASPVAQTYTAVFSANLAGDDNGAQSGIDFTAVDSTSAIAFDGSTISVVGSPAKMIWLFAVNGTLQASAASQTLDVAGIAPGIYIVKAATDNGILSAKIKI